MIWILYWLVTLQGKKLRFLWSKWRILKYLGLIVCLQFFSNTIGVTLEMMSLRLFFHYLIWGLSYLAQIILILLLLLKIKALLSVTKFRPIVICNILYKVISKVLANQLMRMLHKIISESQSAFQENKSILDNSLVAFETLHHMNTKSLVNRVLWPVN